MAAARGNTAKTELLVTKLPIVGPTKDPALMGKNANDMIRPRVSEETELDSTANDRANTVEATPLRRTQAIPKLTTVCANNGIGHNTISAATAIIRTRQWPTRSATILKRD